jgi:hypothetical protein
MRSCPLWFYSTIFVITKLKFDNFFEYISGVNSANFVNFWKTSPNFQHDKIEEKHWSWHSIVLHITSIVRMPNARSLGRLIALIGGVYGFQSSVYEFSSMLLIAPNFERKGCPPFPLHSFTEFLY